MVLRINQKNVLADLSGSINRWKEISSSSLECATDSPMDFGLVKLVEKNKGNWEIVTGDAYIQDLFDSKIPVSVYNFPYEEGEGEKQFSGVLIVERSSEKGLKKRYRVGFETPTENRADPFKIRAVLYAIYHSAKQEAIESKKT